MALTNELANYHALCERVDTFARRVTKEYGPLMVCRQGCDSCCRHLSLFPVEAYALAEALAALPTAEQKIIRARAVTATPETCPLLVGGSCQLYQARPLICRTHGLPLLVVTETTKIIDFCPQNFNGITSFPGSAVLELEQLNTVLATVNAIFVQSVLPGSSPARFTIAESLLLRH